MARPGPHSQQVAEQGFRPDADSKGFTLSPLPPSKLLSARKTCLQIPSRISGPWLGPIKSGSLQLPPHGPCPSCGRVGCFLDRPFLQAEQSGARKSPFLWPHLHNPHNPMQTQLLFVILIMWRKMSGAGRRLAPDFQALSPKAIPTAHPSQICHGYGAESRFRHQRFERAAAWPSIPVFPWGCLGPWNHWRKEGLAPAQRSAIGGC